MLAAVFRVSSLRAIGMACSLRWLRSGPWQVKPAMPTYATPWSFAPATVKGGRTDLVRSVSGL